MPTPRPGGRPGAAGACSPWAGRAAVGVVVGALSLGSAVPGACQAPTDGSEFTELFGTAFNERGMPLPGASVELRFSLDRESRACRSFSTDAEGNFSAFLPNKIECAGRSWSFPAPFYVKVTSVPDADGHRALDPLRWLHVRPRGAPLELTLKAGDSGITREPDCGICRGCLREASRRTVMGTVRDVAGHPVASARIRIGLQGSDAAGWVETDSSGRFEAWLPEGGRCGGPLRYPATLTLSLDAPQGYYFRQPPARQELLVASQSAAREVHWGGKGAMLAPLLPALGRVCGKVRLGPRDLPYGFVSLFADTRSWAGEDGAGLGAPRPGSTEQSLVRLTKEGFCLEGVAPGNYLLKVTPPNVWPVGSQIDQLFLGLSYRGLDGASEDYRLSFDDLGRARLYDAGGKLVHESGLPDLIVVQELSSAPKRLEGIVRPPPAQEGKPADDTPLLFAQVFSTNVTGPTILSNSYHFAWLENLREGGPAQPFSLPVAEGRLHALRIYSQRLALASVRLPVARDIASSWGPVELRAARASWVKGSAKLPDGRPFRPNLRREGRKKSFLSVRAAHFWDNPYTADGDYVDAKGRFSLPPLSPGFYRLEAQGDGEGFDWSVDPARWFWLEPGATRSHDIVLGERADVCVDLGEAGLSPYPDVRPDDLVLFWMSSPRERWIVGLRSGDLNEEAISHLLYSDWAPFSFLQDTRGRWVPRSRIGPSSDLTARTSPGLYDVYLIERTDKFTLPSFSVLAVEKGLRVAKAAVSKIRFGDRSFVKKPETELRGRLRYRPRVDAAHLRAARSLAQLHAMVVPRINFYDALNAYAGSAFLSLTADQLGRLIEGIEKDNPIQVGQFLDLWPYEFSMHGLRPGRYRAEVVAHGYPKRIVEAFVEESKTSRLELNLDAPER